MVHGKGAEHDTRLEKVLQASDENENNITFWAEKCQFGKKRVAWFGMVYSKEGMSPDPKKVDLIKSWP